MSNSGKCPYNPAGQGTANLDWWPNQLRVDLLNQHSERSNPLGDDFNYAAEFKKINYSELKGDIKKAMTRDITNGELFRSIREECSAAEWAGNEFTERFNCKNK